MANPFLVIGGVAVGVVTAGIGILAVPGWIDSAHDSAAISDLAAISDAQASSLATEATFVPDIETLTETGAAGTRVQPSNGVTWVDLEAENGDYWCATVQSKSGAYFSMTNEAAGPVESDSAEAGLCMDQAELTFKCDEDTAVRLPFVGGNGTVTWSGGGVETELPLAESFTVRAGVEYEATFVGTASQIKASAVGGRDCLREVSEWPEGLTSLVSAFKGATNLVSVPSTLPSGVTTLRSAFYDATSFDGDLSKWDVSNVTDMYATFYGATSFSGDLSKWHVSNVTDMYAMFYNAGAFDADLSEWDVSNVTDMHAMFSRASAFTSDLSGWDVSNVTDMYSVFRNATRFTSDLSEWDVSNVTDMYAMFQGATSFDSDLSGWDVSKVTSRDLFGSQSNIGAGHLPAFT